MEEKKKITRLGGKPGQNRATVTEESRSTRSVTAGHAKELMQRAGSLYLPEGAKYVGSVAVHYYSKEVLGHPTFFFATQLNVKDVNEGHAGLGITSLRTQVMEAYGHNERTRK